MSGGRSQWGQTGGLQWWKRGDNHTGSQRREDEGWTEEEARSHRKGLGTIVYVPLPSQGGGWLGPLPMAPSLTRSWWVRSN